MAKAPHFARWDRGLSDRAVDQGELRLKLLSFLADIAPVEDSRSMAVSISSSFHVLARG